MRWTSATEEGRCARSSSPRSRTVTAKRFDVVFLDPGNFTMKLTVSSRAATASVVVGGTPQPLVVSSTPASLWP